MPALRATLLLLLVIVPSTIVHIVPLLAVTLLKALLPSARLRRACNPLLTGLAESWIGINNLLFDHCVHTRLDLHEQASLQRDGHYLVFANHQSWVDILVLQRVLHGHVPFLKFFLKAELIWVPVIGLAWWALDFPFMKRGKGRGARHNDLRTTREACEKFKRIPTTVMNFVEGTRFTPAKHAAQASPYRHLLKPKIGGLGIALATMGEQFEALLDVTIVYPHGAPTFWHLLCGGIDAVTVRVRQCAIPPDLLGGDPMGDKAYRQRIGTWVEAQWAEKDALIDSLLQADAQARPPAPH
ncbi:MAG: acyltransferase [Rhodanobacteraceae bacterium]|nr:acyltransferase [Rhodanobacteraceae bacterium]